MFFFTKFNREEVKGILLALSCADHESYLNPKFIKQIAEKCEKMYPGVLKETCTGGLILVPTITCD